MDLRAGEKRFYNSMLNITKREALSLDVSFLKIYKPWIEKNVKPVLVRYTI